MQPFQRIATTIGLYFDGVAGTLTYYKDGTCLGVAFTGLQDVTEPLYPIVCSTAYRTGGGTMGFSITVDKYEFKLLQFCLYLFTLLINFLQPIINVKLFFFLAMSLGLLKREFHSLQDRCRATILGHLTHEEQIDELKLPQRIKLFIHEGLNNFQDDDATHNISQSN